MKGELYLIILLSFSGAYAQEPSSSEATEIDGTAPADYKVQQALIDLEKLLTEYPQLQKEYGELTEQERESLDAVLEKFNELFFIVFCYLTEHPDALSI